MSQTLKEAPLTTRNARAKLDLGLYWRGVDPDIHLGYRKGKRGGRWLVRWYEGKGVYRQHAIGTADDALDGDGTHTYSFSQALTAARAHVAAARAGSLAISALPPLTVQKAVEDYIALRERREEQLKGPGGMRRDYRSRLTKYVLSDPSFSANLLAGLSEIELSRWRNAFPSSLAHATVRRTCSDLKAALNGAARTYRSTLPAHFTVIVKNGFSFGYDVAPTTRDYQILSDAEVRRVIEASRHVDDEEEWEGGLARLIAILAATGARFSQAVRIKIKDV